ncbi:MAG: SRPBCC domain-containing protein [Bacteroidetes bacterium]|nr:SRPBCC domain-containing protein [Bacteroidota bacterium]
MTKSFSLSIELPASPEVIYNAWLDSEQHSDMTGSPAEISDQLQESFTAWDGYIFGTNLELTPFRKIIQSWRTTEFEDDEPDSLLEITLEPLGENTMLHLHHSNLPAHGDAYIQGWHEFYFDPMLTYFAQLEP